MASLRLALAFKALTLIFVRLSGVAATGEVVITHSSISTSSIPLWLAQRLSPGARAQRTCAVNDSAFKASAAASGSPQLFG